MPLHSELDCQLDCYLNTFKRLFFNVDAYFADVIISPLFTPPRQQRGSESEARSMTDHDLLQLHRAGLSAIKIASIIGCTRQRVWQRLKALNEPLRPKSAQVRCSLPGCTKTFKLHNSRKAKAAKAFCCREHYYAYRPTLNPNYFQWRHGTRLARAEVAKHFPLEPQQVVHHVNGDQRDNRPENLAVFASQTDHMTYHHGRRRVTPMWEGLPGSTAANGAGRVVSSWPDAM